MLRPARVLALLTLLGLPLFGLTAPAVAGEMELVLDWSHKIPAYAKGLCLFAPGEGVLKIDALKAANAAASVVDASASLEVSADQAPLETHDGRRLGLVPPLPADPSSSSLGTDADSGDALTKIGTRVPGASKLIKFNKTYGHPTVSLHGTYGVGWSGPLP